MSKRNLDISDSQNSSETDIDIDFPNSSFVRDIFGGTPEQQKLATIAVRLMLVTDDQPPMDFVVDVPGLLDKLVEFLRQPEYPDLQSESIILLGCIAAEHSDEVAEAGAIDELLRILEPTRGERLQVLVISTLASIGFGLERNGMARLVNCMQRALESGRSRESRYIVIYGVEACLSISWGRPSTNYSLVEECVPILKQVIDAGYRDSVLANATSALANIAGIGEDGIMGVCENGFCQTALKLLGHPHHQTQAAAIQLVRNIVTSDNPDHTQHMLDIGILNALKPLLSIKDKDIRGLAGWTVRNITFGEEQQVQAVLDSGILHDMMELSSRDDEEYHKKLALAYKTPCSCGRLPFFVGERCSADEDFKKTCVWAIINAIIEVPSQIEQLVNLNVIGYLSRFLKSQKGASKEVIAVLDIFEEICLLGEDSIVDGVGKNPYTELIELEGVIPFIHKYKLDAQALKLHNKASDLLENHFKDARKEIPCGIQ